MDDETQNAVLFGQLRTALAVAGGAIVAQGIASQATVNIVLGVATVIIPFILSALSKERASKIAKAREVVAVNVGIVKADNTVGPTPPVSPAMAAALIAKIAPTLPESVKAAP